MEIEPPSHSKARQAAQAGLEAGLNLVPMVGGTVAVVLMTALNHGLKKRQEAWFTELAEAVEDLRGKVDGFDPEALGENDAFLDAVMTATRIAERNSQQTKLEALRNALLNAALPGAPDQDDQQHYFRLIDDLTPTHIRLLDLLNDPPGWFDRTGLPRPEFGMSSNRTALIQAGMPELAEKGQEAIRRYYTGLESANLLAGSLGGMMTGSGAWGSATNELGRDFLAFIRDPR
ncbi:hypothetical protein GA0074695_5253 [Micromonospora viridifaciens]|uniref:Uncharacterized protein n=1 Tax=Micromonospora viridifaciens TaxID=1881 RepID=A0A1C4Z941_MICVI|nr:hypothetical protein [Micromonospora viridifaciens]SCF29428.1 hypothetical protein GA0074695_5253 [Micromonospora viridifaciens]